MLAKKPYGEANELATIHPPQLPFQASHVNNHMAILVQDLKCRAFIAPKLSLHQHQQEELLRILPEVLKPPLNEMKQCLCRNCWNAASPNLQDKSLTCCLNSGDLLIDDDDFVASVFLHILFKCTRLQALENCTH